MRYEIGELVKVKDDLVVGYVHYGNDGKTSCYFTIHMEKFIGQTGLVLGYKNGGYVLQFGEEICKPVFLDTMLERFTDNIKDKEEIDSDAEKVIRNFELHNIKRSIDSALDSKLHITEPKELEKLVDLYKSKK